MNHKQFLHQIAFALGFWAILVSTGAAQNPPPPFVLQRTLSDFHVEYEV
jgi:hypothetical protein